MLMTGFAQEPDLLQPAADLMAGLARLLRQPQPERPVGKADSVTLDQLRIIEPPTCEVRERLRGLLQALVVIPDRLVKQRLIARIEVYRCR